jgi:hypothetical protein
MKYTNPKIGWMVLIVVGLALATIGRSMAYADDNAAPSPTVHTGDVWVDRLSGKDQEFKVTSVTADTIYFTQWSAEQQSDLQWNSTVYRSLTTAGTTPITYSKPLLVYPFPLTPGKTWTEELKWQVREPSLEGRDEVKGQVGDWEDVAVPAGTFHAIKVDVTIRAIGHGGVRDVTTIRYWYAPKANRFVKSHLDSQIDAVVLDAEMVSYTPAKQ